MKIPLLPFDPFKKIPRLNRECVITCKLDGTSGTIYIDDSGEIFAASRNRWITPENDNYSFAKWVEEHKDELLQLGPGWHRGEYWGSGIQRGYGLKEKRFSLFNTFRWSLAGDLLEGQEHPPACCHVVPVLFRGLFTTENVMNTLAKLSANGSYAAPGWMKPEGICIYHEAAKQYFKVTLENDSQPKGNANE